MNDEQNNSGNQPNKRGGKPRSHGFRRRRPQRPGNANPNAEEASNQQQQQQRQRQPRPERPKQELKTCRVCGKPIFDLAGALSSREDGEPIHFDCAIEQLAKEEHLAADEKLMYIGSGQFGVCAHGPGGKLEIRRKVRWEASGTSQPWRKPMISSPNLP